jgi:hypothetical protein
MSKIVGVTVGTPLSLSRIKREINPVIEEKVTTHENNTENPHSVTAYQVGLGNVDNTSDMDKPVSTAQAQAIDVVARSAQQKHITRTVTLPASGWVNNMQTVAVDGITSNNTLLVASAPENYDKYSKASIYCSAQAEGTLTFMCTSSPDTELNVNIMIFN